METVTDTDHLSFLYQDILPNVLQSSLSSPSSTYSVLPVWKIMVIAVTFGICRFIYDRTHNMYHGKLKEDTMVSLAYSVFASIGASYILLFQHSLWSIPESFTYSSQIPHCNVIFAITLGYFLWDTFINFANATTWDFRIHSLFCVYVYSFASFTPHLHRPAIIVLSFEISTVFLRLSRISGFHKMKTLATYFKLLFASTFFIFRIIIGSKVTYELWSIFWLGTMDVEHSDVPLWFWQSIIIINLLFDFLNFYWFGYIVMIALGLRKRKTKRKHPEITKEFDSVKCIN